MLANRLRLGTIAAWLGVIALGFNALVPIHLAFDLADALAPAEHNHAAADHDFARCLLTLLTGHRGHGHDHPPLHKADHHDSGCAVGAAVGTLAGFAPAAAALLPLPFEVHATAPLTPEIAAPAAAAIVAYRSRAPPLA